ncbi:lipopolysaccharide biosynthesis protein [Ancylobacter sp. G4_0304]|uniref:lipopolysaccharide biosynthesis protein n=1 Tax=Ancylobacter sp. G4_0304 TaxID=3114289 RepID=UPI0039C5ABD4
MLTQRLRRMMSGTTGRIFHGMARLALGGAAARVVSLCTVPILARLYTPADYGLVAVYTALVQMLLPVVALRYPMAIPLPRRDEMALALFTLSCLLTLGIGALVGVALFFLGPWLLDLFSAEALAPWWFLLPIGLLMAGFSEILNSWATRRRAYQLMAVNSVAAVLVGDGLKLGLGFLGVRPLGLLFGQMANQSGGILRFTQVFLKDFRRIPKVVTRSRLLFIASFYKDYPIYRLPSQIILVFTMQAPLLYTAKFYGIAVSGQLGLALTMLALPVAIIGQSIGRAYYAELAQLGRNRPEQIFSVTVKIQLLLFAAGIVPTLALMFLGPLMFRIAFGPQWELAGHYASLLSIYILLQFTSAPLMQLLNIYNRQRAFLVMNVLRAIAFVALCLAVTHFELSAENYVRIYSLQMVVFYAAASIYILYVAYQLKNSRSAISAR